MCAEVLAPFLGLRARCSCDDGKAGELARQLNEYGTHATGSADHKYAARSDGLTWLNGETIEENFPSREAGKWQCRGLDKAQSLRFAAHNPFIHKVQLRIGSGTHQRAGVKDFVAGPKH